MKYFRWLFPQRCIFCGRIVTDGKLICKLCTAEHLVIAGEICKFCGLEKSRCSCGQKKHYYERKIACVYYDGGVKCGIARFKFYRHTMLATDYGQIMAHNIQSKFSDIVLDYIVPVPMHPWNRWKRGYNCTELLAEEISRNIGIPVLADGLYKKRRNKIQKRLKYAQRTANVLDAFSSKQSEKLQGKTILLIDDICTSGATLNECAKILKLYGAKKVYAATFAAARFYFENKKRLE